MKNITVLLLLFISTITIAQVKGKITDKEGEPLSFVSVYLDKTVTGTTSNDNGDYVLELNKKGTHTVVFQFLGFKTLKKEINITSFPFELNAILEEENIKLDEISISTKDNPANRIIRNVIANKEKNTDKFSNYTAKFYSRGLTRIKDAPESFLGRSTGDFGGGLDSTRTGIIYLSETFSNISFQKKPKQFKEKIVASKVSGQDNGISFNRAEDSNLDLYENSLAVFNDLVSPISTNAFSYYNYKLVGTFYEKNEKLINKIKLIPKRKNDRVFDGFIYIVEDDWALYGVDVTTTGAQVNIPIVNSLKLKQSYNYADEIAGWVLISQTIDFDIKFFGFKPNGKFSYVYSDYNFEPNFTETTFTNEVLSFEENATKKDVAFWNTLRPVPLTEEEITDYSVKDSIKVIRKSKKYLDSLDAKGNKFGWLDPLKGYTHRNSYKNNSFSYNGPLVRTGFNTVQGINASAGFSYFEQINEEGKWWTASIIANYGFSDKRVRPTFSFTKKWDNFSKPRLTISGGTITPQFNEREPIFKLNNTIASLFYRNNYMKIYEKTFTEVRYSEEIRNGFYVESSLEYAKRTPLFNTTDYSFAKQNDTGYTSNNPLDQTDFTNGAFEEHTIASLNIGATFVFRQKYLSYPDRKSNEGSDTYPTVSVNYRKRFGAENSDLNSDLFTANIKQDIQAGNYGDFSYTIRGGIFAEKKDIAFMDNLQANGNQLWFPIDRELNSFNLLEYYKYYTNDRYAEMHLEHNFKGALLGKVPLLNKLSLHLVAGGKALFMADKNPYTEYSIGLANLGFGKYRFLRFEYVSARYGDVKETGFVFRASLF
ncbi:MULTISPECIES: DUF5686 and carboxypeptidase regulatory-like domain-containing protein [unclassified Polaribacter]|uniref:DUF5686 and carboxypeptidase regulatory-like domain-containing protein n=1 Tax=unclassified Polaribacter TaxID=196858 RepID=UPI0011BDB7BF|nr:MULTISPECIES: DUF5686 and carboxypeptidase regulatory-like domain-containing protein [unclassified Polaribacter]TXD53210.1 carboxypeptidase-like regulatory domain-containing protein [Polaribacter sp. IC063]TXD61357.1 carboxypeptidase-like regulatory domain-containing protein [Polaribacter sp. IC066]